MPITKKDIIKSIEEAKNNSKKRGFSQSVDLIVVLKEIDVKKPENRINELIELPTAPSKDVKVGIFASGDLALRAEKAGVDKVFNKETIDGILNDKKNARKLVKGIDVFLAEASFMPLIGRAFGQILGPKGKMPTPIPPTAPIETIIEQSRKKIRVRIRDQLNTQCKVGTEDMDNEIIAENVQAVFNRLERKLEKGLKNIHEAYIKTTMGSPIKIKI